MPEYIPHETKLDINSVVPDYVFELLGFTKVNCGQYGWKWRQVMAYEQKLDIHCGATWWQFNAHLLSWTSYCHGKGVDYGINEVQEKMQAILGLKAPQGLKLKSMSALKRNKKV